MSLINKEMLIKKVNFYINDENRQRIFKDNPMMANMLNDILSICMSEPVVLPAELNTEDLQLIHECLLASLKVCEAVKAKGKSKKVGEVLNKVVDLELDCEPT